VVGSTINDSVMDAMSGGVLMDFRDDDKLSRAELLAVFEFDDGHSSKCQNISREVPQQGHDSVVP
jgi:hypothetical protein